MDDPDLRMLIEAWAQLPLALRKSIVATVRAALDSDQQDDEQIALASVGG